MKNITLIITVFIFTFSLSAQNFSGKATYKTHRKVNVKLGEDKETSSSMQKMIQEQMKKHFQKTFHLNFNQNESTYKQEAQLSAPQASNGVRVMSIGGGSNNDILYKNIKENRYTNKTEISSKRFLIQDKLPKSEWEMSGETKTIGKYTCYKATKTRTREQRNFTDNEVTKKTVTITTTAWYTPEIPISNGPEMFGGLPGLILEIQDGKQTIVCSEIILNPTEKIEITEPTKGKKITQVKFDEIMDKKRDEMLERFKNNRSSRDGNRISIQIGG